MQLENMMEMYQPRVSEIRPQAYFVVGDLESLSASALYSNSPEYDKYIGETWREDGAHKGTEYDHINYEVWMKKIGAKKGRNKKLSNTHILISPAIKSGS